MKPGFVQNVPAGTKYTKLDCGKNKVQSTNPKTHNANRISLELSLWMPAYLKA